MRALRYSKKIVLKHLPLNSFVTIIVIVTGAVTVTVTILITRAKRR